MEINAQTAAGYVRERGQVGPHDTVHIAGFSDLSLPTSDLRPPPSLPQHIGQRLLHRRWIAGHQPGD
ncbi:MAG: hypothetical protein L0219_18480, partial [Phycisphaerales bacterium]|nr:hypothetical protein [Phycisphaerales bacterium]